MVTGANNRLSVVLVLTTLALSAFFVAQGTTALLAVEVASKDTNPSEWSGRTVLSSRIQRKRDPTIILKRNIFSSAQGDLTGADIENPELPLDDPDQVEKPCDGTMRLIGTVVLPGQLERSLAAIVGADRKAALHRGGTEVEGSTIRAIQSDSVILQHSTGFCRLAMFEVSGPEKKRPPTKRTRPARKSRPKRRVDADRNAGLTDTEIAEGIEKVNDTNFIVSRAMLNKVLDNAGKLIGIAAVAPKLEDGRSVGMQIYGVRADTLLTKLGIRNGDILESVNGQPLTSTDSALGAYTTLRTADEFNLTVRRGGRSTMIRYRLQ